MPLLDHFHPPLSERRSWEGFHGLWAAALVEKLNGEVLGEDYFADMQVHVGSQVEVDVATLTERDSAGQGGAATMARTWSPTATSLVPPTLFPDDIEVQVLSTVAGPTLVAAIELVSPGNKDRPEVWRAFAAKCVGYLTRGIGLIVVDIVTNRSANLHNEIVALLKDETRYQMTTSSPAYVTAYRPKRTPAGDQIEIWTHGLTIGDELPVLPLSLRNAKTVPVDLEATYTDARLRYRLN